MVKPSVSHILGMAGPIDVKWKGSSSRGYWVDYVTLTFGLTHGLDLEFIQVKFRNSSISEIVGLIDIKRKGSKSTGYWNIWPLLLTTPMTLTLNFKPQPLVSMEKTICKIQFIIKNIFLNFPHECRDWDDLMLRITTSCDTD